MYTAAPMAPFFIAGMYHPGAPFDALYEIIYGEMSEDFDNIRNGPKAHKTTRRKGCKD